MNEWLIWSIEHSAWWRPNEAGYTRNRDEAGRYSFSCASQIVDSANRTIGNVPMEAMVLDRFEYAPRKEGA